MMKTALSVALILLLTGCITVGPDYEVTVTFSLEEAARTAHDVALFTCAVEPARCDNILAAADFLATIAGMLEHPTMDLLTGPPFNLEPGVAAAVIIVWSRLQREYGDFAVLGADYCHAIAEALYAGAEEAGIQRQVAASVR